MTNESSANAEKPDRPALGISLRILSGALFAVMAIFVKKVSNDVPVGQIVSPVRLCAHSPDFLPVDEGGVSERTGHAASL
ncbi:hypothetical protein [Rhizobium sp. 'Codium 1']|uniref:hypothetical protein n=1 Tax=Rhizobium sp. 'Codium 1' TaxID=2940484 RepID=UPI001E466FCD|nr:hypothetical protein [Rhizobium sp. 'Codium 1']MCC8934800.1 hypothetical protein [Rhizobium sp. 'Codium 1']